MSLQPMDLYEKLVHPAAMGTVGDGRLRPIPATIKPGRNSKRVYVDLPRLEETPTSDAPKLDRVGPQLPPFPEMWLETRILPSKYGDATVPGAVTGALVRDQGIPRGESRSEVKTHVTVDLFMMVDGTGQIAFGSGLVLAVKEDGAIEEYFPVRVSSSSGLSWEDSEDKVGPPPNGFQLESDWALPALTAIGLMNCRNVTVERHERPVKRSKKQRRNRQPKLDYHTIILPVVKSSSGASGDHQDVMPRHKVRGHFKTYTADAPLMGKHTGTYWWGWQVRGNKKNGITITDYKLTGASA